MGDHRGSPGAVYSLLSFLYVSKCVCVCAYVCVCVALRLRVSVIVFCVGIDECFFVWTFVRRF